MEDYITAYLKSVSKSLRTGNTTEHSFRGHLEILLKKLTGFEVVNEARRIDCGAPDLTLCKDNKIPVGYVEAKNVDKDLNSKEYREQFDRYRKALDNLIFTNYLTFQFLKGGDSITEISIGKILSGKIEPIPENFNRFIERIRAFSQYNGKSIANSKQLAEYMADKTKLLAEVIEKGISDRSGNNHLQQQLKGFQEILLPAITQKQFADLYAQTIAYGLFISRLQSGISNVKFTRQRAEKFIPKSNPFLKNLFHFIAYDLDEGVYWMVDSLADLFNYVDMKAIDREFISRDKDPFLHFYEDFLTKYDKETKVDRGAYYTPTAVVQFIVRGVDDILKTDFSLVKGLADDSKVNIKNKEYHKVQILDPATGTGAFLAEVVRKIHQAFKGNEGMWNGYVKEHLIPCLNGFEIMMSSYTMAHLKIEILLQELGYQAKVADNFRLQIYLTDSLENSEKNVNPIPFAQWLSDEAAEAAKIKNNVPVMVILGNPPYNVKGQNNGKWIKDLMRQYKTGADGEPLEEKNWQPLNDDYVKFIRFGQYFVEKNGEGILAYINNHGFLNNSTFRGMRYQLLRAFDKIYILDLHGNARKNETVPDSSKDENVFDITVGVSINFFIKTGKKEEGLLAKVFHADLFGTKEKKYRFLSENTLRTVAWEELQPHSSDYFFVPKNFENREEYEKRFSINELFDRKSVGISSARDETAIQNSRKNLKQVLNDFKKLSEAEIKQKYKTEIKESGEKKTAYAKRNIVNFGISEKYLQPINYRPFDVKYTYYTKSKGFLIRPRYDLMQHFIEGENIGLVTVRRCNGGGGDWRHVFITRNITDVHLMGDHSYIYPLYLYQKNLGTVEKVENLKEAVRSEFKTALEFSPSPEQILDYIYAILHSPSYREKYRESLKIDFPRIPYPKNAEQFNQLSAGGEKLRRLHLMENVAVPDKFADFPKSGSDKVEKFPACQYDKVWINDSQYFDHVSNEAWNFTIGGYQPAQKWLKDRKGRTLTCEDIRHYQKIIFVLNETDKIMKEIDLKKLI